MSSVYETGYIYKILTNDKQYIGSTNNFSLRKSTHVSNCKSKSKNATFELLKELNFPLTNSKKNN